MISFSAVWTVSGVDIFPLGDASTVLPFQIKVLANILCNEASQEQTKQCLIYIQSTWTDYPTCVTHTENITFLLAHISSTHDERAFLASDFKDCDAPDWSVFIKSVYPVFKK